MRTLPSHLIGNVEGLRPYRKLGESAASIFVLMAISVVQSDAQGIITTIAGNGSHGNQVTVGIAASRLPGFRSTAIIEPVLEPISEQFS
jgi:hypothetical protein